MGPAPQGGSCEGGKVSTHWEAPSLAEIGGGRGGKLLSNRGERSNRGAEGKGGRSHTEDQSQPALTSLRGLSAHLPGWVGVGSWDLGFGGQIPGRGLGLALWTQTEGGWCITASREGVWEKFWTCLRGKRPLLWGVRGEGIPSLSAYRRQSTT